MTEWKDRKDAKTPIEHIIDAVSAPIHFPPPILIMSKEQEEFYRKKGMIPDGYTVLNPVKKYKPLRNKK